MYQNYKKNLIVKFSSLMNWIHGLILGSNNINSNNQSRIKIDNITINNNKINHNKIATIINQKHNKIFNNFIMKEELV